MSATIIPLHIARHLREPDAATDRRYDKATEHLEIRDHCQALRLARPDAVLIGGLLDMMATEHSWRAHAWTALAERRPDVARESARKARQWRRLTRFAR